MDSFKQIVSNLEDNVSQLLTQNKALKKKLKIISEENVHLKLENSKQTEFIKQKDESLEMLKIAGKIDNGENKEVKIKIDSLLREIDKCIAQIDK